MLRSLQPVGSAMSIAMKDLVKIMCLIMSRYNAASLGAMAEICIIAVESIKSWAVRLDVAADLAKYNNIEASAYKGRCYVQYSILQRSYLSNSAGSYIYIVTCDTNLFSEYE